MLKKAVEWGVIEHMPCNIRLLPLPPSSAAFHDFDEFERLVQAAKKRAYEAYLIVLLGGEAGLRRGEIPALEWVTST
jgi:integrase